ncbi:MAG: YfhO family protein [Bacilli bacterium]|nr:YfhO family protein [Bacilli bacterium]
MTANTQNINLKQSASFISKILVPFKNINSLFYYYLFLVVLGVVFFSTSLFINNFTTPFTGDYVYQQYAFYTNGYDDWWHFFKKGEFVLYDTNTFLGVDNIGANSFYYLFDPFFMPILIFPRQLVPQGMAILTIFKMALSGLAFYAYMRRLGASRRASKITGVAYAFSGWITWYLWFNHFTGVAVAFPLILLGIENVLKKKNPTVLMSAICLIGFINFFFMYSYVLCALLYASFRYIQTVKTRNKNDNLIILLLIVAGFVVGIMLPAMTVFPSLLHALSSPRASSNGFFNYLVEALKKGNLKRAFELLITWTSLNNSALEKARTIYPFVEFVFPVISCRGTSLMIYGSDTYDNVAGSFYCFLPMLLLLFPAFRSSIKKKHFSVLVALGFFLFALFTPCFYYMFHGFTVAYSRWTLFVVTSIMAYAGLYLDEIKKDNYVVLVQSCAILIIVVLISGLLAQTIIATENSMFKERVPIWLAVSLESLYLLILTTVLCLIKAKKKPSFYWVFTGFLVAEISIMGGLVIYGHGVEDYSQTNKGYVKNDCLHSIVERISKEDPAYYRCYSSLSCSEAPNDGMRNGYNGIGTFHSVYNYNTADLCNWSSITNGKAPASWMGTYVQKRINLDTVLGVKYYLVEDDYFAKQNRISVSSEDFRYNVPLNYFDISSDYDNHEFLVFENKDYIDFALTFDNFYVVNGNPTTNKPYEGIYEDDRRVLLNEDLYLKTAIINSYREQSIVDELRNQTDISELPAQNKTINDLYYSLSINRYGNPDSGQDALLTYYDFATANENNLDVNASVYLSLNSSTTKYEKLSRVAIADREQRYVEVIESTGEYFPNYDSKGNIYYLTASFDQGYGTDIYFVDTNNKIVTFDNHNDEYTNAGRSGKEERAFYISPTYELDSNGELIITKDAPKIKKIIIVNRGKKVNFSHNIAIDTFTNHETKIASLKANTVFDVTSSTNKWTFKSDFASKRIVVTRLAYEDGFKLKMTDSAGNKKDVEVFNAQGGFVSFISGVGECSYELVFETPNLKMSSLISSFGVFAYFATIVSYVFIDMKQKEKEISFIL